MNKPDYEVTHCDTESDTDEDAGTCSACVDTNGICLERCDDDE